MGIIRINELPSGSGSLTSDDLVVFMDDPSGSQSTRKLTVAELASIIGAGSPTYDAAVEWTANHTLVDGTRYLAGDLVYSDGYLYRAKFDNESLPVTNTTYWENVGSGYRLNIDGRDIQNIPNIFDQNLNTTDTVQFSGVKIGTSSQVWSITRNVGSEALEFKHFSSINPKLKISADGALIFSDNTFQTTSALPLAHNNYIICNNGDDLAAKYAAAKLLTPSGNPISATNRATLIIMPGNYTLSEELLIDAEFVDILGLGSMKLDRGCKTAVTLLTHTINVSANDVRVKGISVGTQQFKIGNNLPLQVIEDCAGGSSSFGGTMVTVSGTFINCIGGSSSFGGYASIASGTFTNCVSNGNSSFGGYAGTASGTFTNCVGEEGSFGAETASGEFKYCIAKSYSFGNTFSGSMSGFLLSCILLTIGDIFQTPSGSGRIRLCIDGNYDVINADVP